MSKRTAEAGNGDIPLKDRVRPEPMDIDQDKEMGDFEDEFEDEFESEDEIFEAGIDGRPDAEREAEEQAASAVDVDSNGTVQLLIGSESVLTENQADK